MEYIFTFLEGIASFISPCVLPILPIYISYFVGENSKNTKKAVINSIGFVFGFSSVFIILSIFASKLGTLVSDNIKFIKILFGIFVIFFGLNYIGILNISFLNKTKRVNINIKNINFWKAFLFGVMFSFSWTPCIGTFLSSALLLIAKEQNMLKGIILMVIYSIGLGIPFIISAFLLEKLKNMFDFIKKHYEVIKKISGSVLILMGIYMIIY